MLAQPAWLSFFSTLFPYSNDLFHFSHLCLIVLTVRGLRCRLSIKKFLPCAALHFIHLVSCWHQLEAPSGQWNGRNRLRIKTTTTTKKSSASWRTLCLFTEMCSVLWVSVVQESLCLPTGHWAQNIKGKPKLDSQSVRNTSVVAVGISKQREEEDIYQFIICIINDSNMWDR